LRSIEYSGRLVVHFKVKNIFVIFFFFQAEDGIRDGHVTGVQTCALPISPVSADRPAPEGALCPECGGNGCVTTSAEHSSSLVLRSEERRVGKECRSRWSAYR